jgi:hypothetical protein
MDLLPSFGKSTYPTIIIRSLDRRKTTIYNVWKATMSTKTLPHIECVQSFFGGELQVQQPTQPPPTSHVANLTLDDGICTDDNIENLLHALKRIWGYEFFKPEQYEAIQAILHCCAQCFPQVNTVLDFFLYLPHPFTLKHLMVSHRVTY